MPKLDQDDHEADPKLKPDAAPAAAKDHTDDPQITELVYMPGPQDPRTTIVDTVEFKAYEPVKLPDGRLYLGSKLHANPFFSSAHDMKADHDDRKKAWEKSRQIRSTLDKARADADELEKAAL
jgi:hypothetical protein